MPENSKTVRQINFHITRYNPESDHAPYVKTYTIPVREGMTVLDGLHYIKDNLDSSLAWRYSCRMGVCGSCGMSINGRLNLAWMVNRADRFNPVADATAWQPGSATASLTMAPTSCRSTGTQRAICSMPPLPGAHTTSETRSLRFTAQASACSRPPDPKINTFMVVSLLLPMLPEPERLSEQSGGGKSNRG